MLVRNRAARTLLLRIVVARPENVTSTVVPLALAAASHSSRNRSRMRSYSASLSARIMNQADVRSGMMLAAVPPSRMIRGPGR